MDGEAIEARAPDKPSTPAEIEEAVQGLIKIHQRLLGELRANGPDKFVIWSQTQANKDSWAILFACVELERARAAITAGREEIVRETVERVIKVLENVAAEGQAQMNYTHVHRASQESFENYGAGKRDGANVGIKRIRALAPSRTSVPDTDEVGE